VEEMSENRVFEENYNAFLTVARRYLATTNRRGWLIYRNVVLSENPREHLRRKLGATSWRMTPGELEGAFLSLIYSLPSSESEREK
jgi:hypothetical protein